MKKFSRWLLFLTALLVLAGCSSFMGIRQPLYDGQLVEPNEEAITVYHETGEIIGDEKEYYFRYPFSEDIYQSSLDFSENDPILLTAGEYIIGEDLPAGRVTLLGNESIFASENYEAHVGNLILYDKMGEVYFENLFHSLYGPLVAQVDFIPGHSIEIIGKDVEISTFYTPTLPDNPYILMDPPQVFKNLDRIEATQPVTVEEDLIILTAGIYEAGVHLEAGVYEVVNFSAVHSTEIYVFHEGEEPRVFELILNEMSYEMDEDSFLEEALEEVVQAENIKFELQMGDKIYPNLVSSLALQKVE